MEIKKPVVAKVVAPAAPVLTKKPVIIPKKVVAPTPTVKPAVLAVANVTKAKPVALPVKKESPPKFDLKKFQADVALKLTKIKSQKSKQKAVVPPVAVEKKTPPPVPVKP